MSYRCGQLAANYLDSTIYVRDEADASARKQLGCDLLSGTGRKFLRGPRGTGFLYVSKAILDHEVRTFCKVLAQH